MEEKNLKDKKAAHAEAQRKYYIKKSQKAVNFEEQLADKDAKIKHLTEMLELSEDKYSIAKDIIQHRDDKIKRLQSKLDELKPEPKIVPKPFAFSKQKPVVSKKIYRVYRGDETSSED